VLCSRPGGANLNLFLLGAGFNIDSTHEAGPVYGNSIYDGHYQIDCGYPLVADVLKLCFGLDRPPEGKSVEGLFSEALSSGDYKPLERLVDRLMEADYRLAYKLASSNTSNSYRRFFEKFSDAQFLTFNYDSLPEIFLARLRRWCPEDGYGVPVATERQFGTNLPADTRSASLVLHLHGSLCVYTGEFEILGNPFEEVAELVHRRRPLYAFDADSITPCFQGYRRMMSNTGRVGIEERVIAPVPEKSGGLKQAFIRDTYAKALSLLRETGTLVVIGYSFNVHDRVSYNPLLEALARSSERTLTIVSPQANEVRDRIVEEYPPLKVEPVPKTFRMWAADSL
jgi:hypothetical protein